MGLHWDVVWASLLLWQCFLSSAGLVILYNFALKSNKTILNDQCTTTDQEKKHSDHPKVIPALWTCWKLVAGGSKEAFHLVYRAFETLADPEARKRYDNLNQRAHIQSSSKKQKRKKEKVPAKPPAAESPKQQASSFATSSASHGTASRPPREKNNLKKPTDGRQILYTKLLSKLYAILKGLSREVRNDVITKEFTQKQRVLLETWIVKQRDKESELTSSVASLEACPDPKQEVASPALTEEVSGAAGSSCCMALTLSGACKDSAGRKRKRAEIRGICRVTRHNGETEGYKASVGIDLLSISSRSCDLPRALECFGLS